MTYERKLDLLDSITWLPLVIPAIGGLVIAVVCLILSLWHGDRSWLTPGWIGIGVSLLAATLGSLSCQLGRYWLDQWELELRREKAMYEQEMKRRGG